MTTLRTILYSVFLLILVSFQDSNNRTISSNIIQSDPSEIEGTYQIQMINTRSIAYFHEDWVALIKDSRKQNEDAFIQIAPHMRIKVLPFNEINNPNFQAPERVVYINE